MSTNETRSTRCPDCGQEMEIFHHQWLNAGGWSARCRCGRKIEGPRAYPVCTLPTWMAGALRDLAMAQVVIRQLAERIDGLDRAHTEQKARELALLAERDQARADAERYRLALESLTVGGAELEVVDG